MVPILSLCPVLVNYSVLPSQVFPERLLCIHVPSRDQQCCERDGLGSGAGAAGTQVSLFSVATDRGTRPAPNHEIPPKPCAWASQIRRACGKTGGRGGRACLRMSLCSLHTRKPQKKNGIAGRTLWYLIKNDTLLALGQCFFKIVFQECSLLGE